MLGFSGYFFWFWRANILKTSSSPSLSIDWHSIPVYESATVHTLDPAHSESPFKNITECVDVIPSNAKVSCTRIQGVTELMSYYYILAQKLALFYVLELINYVAMFPSLLLIWSYILLAKKTLNLQRNGVLVQPPASLLWVFFRSQDLSFIASEWQVTYYFWMETSLESSMVIPLLHKCVKLGFRIVIVIGPLLWHC